MTQSVFWSRSVHVVFRAHSSVQCEPFSMYHNKGFRCKHAYKCGQLFVGFHFRTVCGCRPTALLGVVVKLFYESTEAGPLMVADSYTVLLATFLHVCRQRAMPAPRPRSRSRSRSRRRRRPAPGTRSTRTWSRRTSRIQTWPRTSSNRPSPAGERPAAVSPNP